jgi:hypothetical protein
VGKCNGVVVMRKTWESSDGANRSTGGIGSIVVCVRKVPSQELGGGQPGRITTPAGDGKHRASKNLIGVSCVPPSDSGTAYGHQVSLGKIWDHRNARLVVAVLIVAADERTQFKKPLLAR